MSSIKVHAGDFAEGKADMSFSAITFAWEAGDGFTGKRVRLDEIAEVDKASEESVKRFGGTVGWGAVGALILGPVGMLAGLLIGGKSTDVTFVAKLKDGRKFLATSDAKTYTKLQAAVF